MWRGLADGRVIAWTQRSSWGHLYLCSPSGGWRAITEGPWLVRSLLGIDEARQRIVFTASGREPGLNPYYAQAYRVNFDGTDLQPLTPEPGHHEFTYGTDMPEWLFDGKQSLSPDGRYLIDVWSTVTEPHRSVLRDTETGAVVLDLATADPAGGWPKAMPLPEPFSVQALEPTGIPGCSELWGLLYKPAGFDPAAHYPVIELIYGGPQVAVVPYDWSGGMFGFWAEQLAAVGFVVVMIDGPGTPGRSHAFQLASYGRLQSCGGLPDHVNAIRQLAATRPWIDLTRVGITGASGGGYATVRALGTFPEFYQVGVALCGNHENAAYTAGWGDTYQGPYDEALYAGQANTSVAANIRGSLLLVHGEMDDNVHPAMTLRVVDALMKADRNFDMLIVPNAPHSVFAVPYVQRRMFDYFVERLAGLKAPPPGPPPGPPPAPSTTPAAPTATTREGNP
jgi:dienelactone hydrolase